MFQEECTHLNAANDLREMKNHHVRIFDARTKDVYTYVVSLRGTSIRPITAGVVGGGFGGASAGSSRDVMSRYLWWSPTGV